MYMSISFVMSHRKHHIKKKNNEETKWETKQYDAMIVIQASWTDLLCVQ